MARGMVGQSGPCYLCDMSVSRPALLLLMVVLPACRDRGQNVPGGGWVGTPLSERSVHQAARDRRTPAPEAVASAAPPTAAPESAGPRFDDAGNGAEAALALLDRPLTSTDPTTEALLAEARRLVGLHRLQDALAEVGRARLRSPEAVPVLMAEAHLLAQLGEHRAAVANYTEILRQQPTNDEATYGMALTQLALGDKSAAAPLVAALQARRGGDVKVQRLVARLTEGAEHLAATAQAAATGNPAALREHGDALLDAGRGAEAVRYYALAATERRDDVDLHLRWGMTLATLGRTAEAVAPLTRVTELAPDRVAGWQGLAEVKVRLGDRTGAIAAWHGLLDRSTGPTADAIRKEIQRLQTEPLPKPGQE